MEFFIKSIIEKLCSIYKYAVIELKSNYGLSSIWAAMKKIDEKLVFMVFVSVENGENIDEYNLKRSLMAEFNTTNIKVVKVFLSQNLKLENGTLVGIENFNWGIVANSSLLVNYIQGKMLFYSSDVESFALEFNYAMNYINYEKMKLKERKKETLPNVTKFLIITNVFLYIITALLSQNLFYSNINVLIFLGAKVNTLIIQGEYYRLFTCMFLHGGLLHITLNMYALYAIGPFIEKAFGKVKYIIIYITSGIMASIFSFYFSNGVSIGASGAIFGLLGASLIFSFKMKNQVGKGFMKNIISVIVVNLIIGFSIANVDNFGHLGGLIGGIITSFLLWGVKSKSETNEKTA
jgi:rhomboid protease GluP